MTLRSMAVVATMFLAQMSQTSLHRGAAGDEAFKGADDAVVDLGDGVEMRLAAIPAGRFIMGSPPSEPSHGEDEMQHLVRITRPFYLGVHEVTQEQYERVMGKNPSLFTESNVGSRRIGGLATNRFPVERVSWNRAVEFCQRLSQHPRERAAGRVYRLPTEAEWEYACRAGGSEMAVPEPSGDAFTYRTTPFHFGRTCNGREANVDGNFPYPGPLLKAEWKQPPQGPFLDRPTVVGSYPPNAWGLYDMHGNVSEWCSDWYGKDYYAVQGTLAPLPPRTLVNLNPEPIVDPQGPNAGKYRVLRGGSWKSLSVDARSANRDTETPDFGNSLMGFRVAATKDAPKR